MSSESLARVLEDGRRRRLLLSLVDQERSLKELAELNQMPLNLAHYHLRRLVAADLVEITREQKRAGRAVRFYQARHAAYFIPAALLRSRPSEQLARSLAKALERSRDRSGAGVLLDVDETGRARMREAAGTAPLPLEIWRRLKLDREEAEALFQELRASIHRYERSARGRRTWTVHLAIGDTSP